MGKLSSYKQGTTDWREQIRKNKRKTRWVIAAFLIIYAALGFLVDGLIHNSPGVGFSQTFKGLLTLQLFPYATITAIIVAAVSLLITFALHNKVMLLGTDSYEITPDSASSLREKQLFHVVEEMKVAAGLAYMPKIYIIEADYMNAFASGYSEKSAMVAITDGLLEKLDRSELQAVMAHELSHIRHLDIKLTLTVAVLTNIILIIVDALFYNAMFSRRRDSDPRLLVIVMVLRYVIILVTVLLTLFLSRTREYMADAGCVELMRDNKPLASALMKIHDDNQKHADYYQDEYSHTAHEEVRKASYLYDPSRAGVKGINSISSMFSTHPSVEKRLAALGFKK